MTQTNAPWTSTPAPRSAAVRFRNGAAGFADRLAASGRLCRDAMSATAWQCPLAPGLKCACPRGSQVDPAAPDRRSDIVRWARPRRWTRLWRCRHVNATCTGAASITHGPFARGATGNTGRGGTSTRHRICGEAAGMPNRSCQGTCGVCRTGPGRGAGSIGRGTRRSARQVEGDSGDGSGGGSGCSPQRLPQTQGCRPQGPGRDSAENA